MPHGNFKRRDQTLKYASLDFYKIHFLTGIKWFWNSGLCEDAEQWGNIRIFILATSECGKRFLILSRFPNFSK